ncbi:MAG: efflux RND transporter periplasmic adaptor subunit [Phycisphaerales bacterium]|nr:efflux RND transporter periplasmic adaptor subunit [Phycisphaerales bacterium]MCI0674480.1 efflux RND transporter periplasmic adaptor subunit [Phycisphaerales bacterium]
MVGCLGGCNRQPAPAAPPAPAVDVAQPVVREVTEWDEYTGRLAAIDTVEVRPRVSGYLESVHFKEGQVVKKGDLLFVIDPRPFQAVLAAAEADVAGAQTRLELARNDAQRSENLVKTGAVSAEDFDRRSKAAVEAQASLDGAKARLDQARLDVEFTEVRAPIDGRTSNYAVTIGNLVSGGASGSGQSTLLTTIVSLNPIHCYIDASEQAYLRYTRLAASGSRPSSRDVANPVHVALADEADFRHEGSMDFVDNRIDPFTGTIRGRAVLDNSNGLLVPGLFVRLRLLGETRPGAVLVPDEAIGTDQSNRVVYVVDDQNIVALRTVVPGRLIDGLRVIRSGLDGSERVVVRGLQRVRPGAAVTPHLVNLETAATTQAASAPASDNRR